MNKGKITQSAIARALNVAPMTVSAALSGKGEQYKLSAETIRKICDYAAEHGYIRNAAARQLRNGNALHVGLIIETRNSYGFASSIALDYILNELNKCGINVSIAGGANFLVCMHHLREQGCNTIIVFTPISEFGTTADFHQKACRLCSGIDCYALNYVYPRFYDKLAMPIYRMGVDRIGVTNLLLDAFDCSNDDYLLDAHCHLESMAMLGKDVKNADELRKSMLRRFHPDALLPVVDGLSTGDYAAVGKAWFKYYQQISLTRKIKTIIVRDDRIAAVLISQALHNNIRIPEDLQIIGFDDLDLGEFLQVPLTSWGIPWMQHARLALDAILHKTEIPHDTISTPIFSWRKSAVLSAEKHSEFMQKLQQNISFDMEYIQSVGK